MELINKVKKLFDKSPKFDYIEYNNKLEKDLNDYFNSNMEYSEQILSKFLNYIFYLCKLKGIYPTKNEIEKYLKREITFNQIRDRWQEFEESSKTQEDYNKIIIYSLI